MSAKSYLEKLLDGEDVQWKALGEVLTRTKGTKITAEQMRGLHKDGAPLKIFAGGKTIARVNFEDIPAKNVSRKPSVIVKSRGFIEFDYYDKPFSHKNEMWSYHSGDDGPNIKYVYHFLKLNEPHFHNIGNRMQMPQIATPDTDKFKIPIPSPSDPERSLKIQAEIVRILDKFDTLTTSIQEGLPREIELRKKQYAYYRDQLLSFEDGKVEWKALGDIAKIQRGASPRPIAAFITDDKSGVPWVKIGDTSTGSKYVIGTAQKITKEGAAKSRVLQKGDFILSNSMSFGRPHILNITGAIHDGWASISNFQETLNSDYLYHYLSSHNVHNYWLTKINSGSVSNLNSDLIKTLEVPIPCPNNPERSLKIQAEIVRILDKFDTLTTSIQEGLPREIELRKKQYAYYRDQLLSFDDGG